MAVLRRLVGALALVLSAVGTLCCVGAIVGVWAFRQKTIDRAEDALARLDVGLQRASAANQNVGRAVRKARADVAEVGKESAAVKKGGEKGRLATRTLKTLIKKKVGPGVEDLSGRLSTLSDAAVVVSSLLQSLQELPAGRIERVKPEQLQQWGEQAEQLSASLRRLEAVVADKGKKTGGQPVAAAAGQVDLVLQRCQETVDAWQSYLDDARGEVGQVRERLPGWLTLGAVAVTVLCGWVAAGQVSLFAHGLRWVRGHPAAAQAGQGPV
jgi:hypothetical protein